MVSFTREHVQFKVQIITCFTWKQSGFAFRIHTFGRTGKLPTWPRPSPTWVCFLWFQLVLKIVFFPAIHWTTTNHVVPTYATLKLVKLRQIRCSRYGFWFSTVGLLITQIPSGTMRFNATALNTSHWCLLQTDHIWKPINWTCFLHGFILHEISWGKKHGFRIVFSLQPLHWLLKTGWICFGHSLQKLEGKNGLRKSAPRHLGPCGCGNDRGS